MGGSGRPPSPPTLATAPAEPGRCSFTPISSQPDKLADPPVMLLVVVGVA
jgi:hypothetical protein